MIIKTKTILIAYIAKIEYLKTEFKSLRIQSHQAIINYEKVRSKKIRAEGQIEKVKQQFQNSVRDFHDQVK